MTGLAKFSPETRCGPGEDGFSLSSVTFAGIPSARAVRPVRDTMGWLTRFLASKMEDPAKRQADFEAHMVETTAKCEEVCVRRNPSPDRDRAVGRRSASDASFRLPLSRDARRAVRRRR